MSIRETSVTGWTGARTLALTAPSGRTTLRAAAIVLATGCRERPRAARLVAGTRPAGVFTTGALQQLVYLERQKIGRRAVVVGAEHVSFSALPTLAAGGATTVALSNATITSGANGVDINGTGGVSTTITGFANNSISGNTTGTGVSVNTATFDSGGGAGFQTVSAGTLVVGASGNPVGTNGVVLANVKGDLSFTDLDNFAGNGAGHIILAEHKPEWCRVSA